MGLIEDELSELRRCCEAQVPNSKVIKSSRKIELIGDRNSIIVVTIESYPDQLAQ